MPHQAREAGRPLIFIAVLGSIAARRPSSVYANIVLNLRPLRGKEHIALIRKKERIRAWLVFIAVHRSIAAPMPSSVYANSVLISHLLTLLIINLLPLRGTSSREFLDEPARLKDRKTSQQGLRTPPAIRQGVCEGGACEEWMPQN